MPVSRVLPGSEQGTSPLVGRYRPPATAYPTGLPADGRTKFPYGRHGLSFIGPEITVMIHHPYAYLYPVLWIDQRYFPATTFALCVLHRCPPPGPHSWPDVHFLAYHDCCASKNPAEDLWQFLRQPYLSNRVFETYEKIAEAAGEARNRLFNQPWRMISIGSRGWAHESQPL